MEIAFILRDLSLNWPFSVKGEIDVFIKKMDKYGGKQLKVHPKEGHLKC